MGAEKRGGDLRKKRRYQATVQRERKNSGNVCEENARLTDGGMILKILDPTERGGGSEGEKWEPKNAGPTSL